MTIRHGLLLPNIARIRPSRRGYCLNTTMLDVQAHPAGIPSATKMANYLESKGRLHTKGVPPKGAIVLWRGGSEGHGHIGPSVGGGRFATVDWRPGLNQTIIPIATCTREWGLPYAGWSSWYADQNLDLAGEPVDLPNVSLARLLAAQKIERSAPRAVVTYPAGKLVEQALAKLGHGSGPVDGHLGTGFTDGVKAFQKALGDKPDGLIGPKQLALLSSRSKLFDAVA